MTRRLVESFVPQVRAALIRENRENRESRESRELPGRLGSTEREGGLGQPGMTHTPTLAYSGGGGPS